MFFLGDFMKYYFEKNLVLYLDDTFERLKKFPENYIDMIFADPPYFLSNDGFSVQSGKRVSVNKGDWDRGSNFEEKHKFNREWLKLAKKILKPNGTIWISGTLHNIFSVGVALEQESFKIIRHQICLADISLTVLKLFCGREKINLQNIFLIMN